MLKPIELIKALFFAILGVIWTIIKTHWEPFYTTTIKMSLTALVLWGICQIIPHGLPILAGISYLGWLTIITLFRLITIKYDDFDDPDELAEIPNTDEEGPPEIQTEVEEPINNVIRKETNDTTSTRE